jgi:hypothetical protein
MTQKPKPFNRIGDLSGKFFEATGSIEDGKTLHHEYPSKRVSWRAKTSLYRKKIGVARVKP